jgi:hypothetical protein
VLWMPVLSWRLMKHYQVRTTQQQRGRFSCSPDASDEREEISRDPIRHRKERKGTLLLWLCVRLCLSFVSVPNWLGYLARAWKISWVLRSCAEPASGVENFTLGGVEGRASRPSLSLSLSLSLYLSVCPLESAANRPVSLPFIERGQWLVMLVPSL